MNKKLIKLAFLGVAMLLSVGLYAQTKLSGSVVDGSDNGKLGKAAVVLLNPVDSILIKFVRSQENGSFTFPTLAHGKYTLIVSYPQYADFVQEIELTEEDKNLGQIKLSKMALLIDEVMVQGRIPVVIKGDTVEYDAASFKVDKDAKVADLLKVLPGITMDASGKITAQGKEVKKILLDGEEFFGNDPTLITKNIRSDMVSKVQVYEKKSEMADRTGIDDGERTQTIDIKLKEGSKKGMFGEATAGYGTDKYYAGKAMLNKFKAAQKISVYGIAANNGLVGLGFEASEKYGMSSSTVNVMDGGGFYISREDSGDGTDSWSGDFSGRGIPRALNMGAAYSDKFKEDKHKINVSFRRNQMDVKNTRNYLSQNNLPDIARLNTSITESENNNRNNIANMRYDVKMDSLTEVTLKMGYNRLDSDNELETNGEERNLSDSLINKTFNQNKGNIIKENLNADVLITRKFKKDKRSITFHANVNSGRNHGDAQYRANTFFTADSTTMRIDQAKRDREDRLSWRSALTYSEPLSKKITASLGYSLESDVNTTLNQSFNYNAATQEYDILDENLLNDFKSSSLKQMINAGLNFKSEVWTINLSNRLDFDNLRRDYNTPNKNLHRDQVSVLPNFSAQYKIDKNTSLRFNYSGRSVQPSLTQIEPLKQNAQQLVEYIDNFDLKAGFSNTISLGYNTYRPLKDKGIYTNVRFSQLENPITSKIVYDKNTGKQQVSFVNLDKSNWNGNAWAGYYTPLIKNWGLNLEIGANANYAINYNYLALNGGNADRNKNTSITMSPTIGFNRSKANKIDFYVSIMPGVQVLNSSLQPNLNSTAFFLRSYGDFMYYFPKDFKIQLGIEQTHNAATKTLKAIDMINSSGYISKKFLKDKSLETQLFVNDIFNRNNGLQRTQQGNLFVQESNQVLRRYMMIKVIYNFTTIKGGS